MIQITHPSVRRTILFFSLAASIFLMAFQEPQPAGGIPSWVWILAVVILILLFAWWAFRSSRQSTSTPGIVEAGRMPAETTQDDLTIIEGIGPKIAAILQAAGITTFNQLAAAGEDRLREILEAGGIRLADPRTWGEQARLAAAGDQEGLKALQDRLNAGREV